MTRPEPLKVGDPVRILIDETEIPGQVLALADWQWILVQTDDGRLWLDVVMNVSAAYWSQLVLLDSSTNAKDLHAISEIARAVAWHPRRVDVVDVPGAERLGRPGERLTGL
ncbi:hypothetical protein [Mesorhizobium sp. 1M-11]|uniref:hypothetical protein n=1 Tax=Mesorhizobium sp. 1M-11 TaxID=1529006 RepID=UPI0006C73BE5|nr:hypothetical protein [Mesorhizobium sp. 1M-11]